MHYTEGSFMPFLVMQLVMDSEFPSFSVWRWVSGP